MQRLREQLINRAALISSQQRLHDVLDVQVADVEVSLPRAHEDDWLARAVHKGQRRADLVADRVELRQHDAVDDAPRLGGGELEERLVEAGDLAEHKRVLLRWPGVCGWARVAAAGCRLRWLGVWLG